MLLQYLQLPVPQATEDMPYPSIKEHALTHYQMVQKNLPDPKTYWSSDYVLADLEKKEVIVWGQMSGMPVGDPVEFAFVGAESGHEYESLSVVFAKPSDVQTALEKIGLRAGGSVGSNPHRFWPRGDRVIAEIQLAKGEESITYSYEKLLLNSQGQEFKKPIPFVFTGSVKVPDPSDPNVMKPAIDLYGPNSVASLFNLAATVMDLPQQGSKTEMYGEFLRNPKIPSVAGTPLLIRLKAAPAAMVEKERNILLTCSGPDKAVVSENKQDKVMSFAELREEWAASGNEWQYVEVGFAPDLPLSDIMQASQALQLMNAEVDSLRFEPPPEGQLYFQSYVPDPTFRDRQKRPSQPLELHLADDAASATLFQLEEVWGEGRRPDIVEKRHLLDNPEAWVTWLKESENQTTVVFLYAASNSTHAQILKWMKPVLDQFPVIFVYKSDLP